MRSVVTLVLAIIAGVLGYGYWHRSTHAVLHVYLTDVSVKERRGNVAGAQLVFLDANGNVLARGKTDDKFGVALIAHPAAGYCGPDLPGAAYRACFLAQSEWFPQWAGNLRYLSLVFGNCRLERIPLEVLVLKDSLLTWWVPLPHVGGVPFTHYHTQIEVDSRACAVTGRRG